MSLFKSPFPPFFWEPTVDQCPGLKPCTADRWQRSAAEPWTFCRCRPTRVSGRCCRWGFFAGMYICIYGGTGKDHPRPPLWDGVGVGDHLWAMCVYIYILIGIYDIYIIRTWHMIQFVCSQSYWFSRHLIFYIRGTNIHEPTAKWQPSPWKTGDWSGTKNNGS